jgi:D-alanine-D-alanine ligase
MRMNGKINVAVLLGGRSGEHDVSLMSARSLLSVLSPEKFEVIPVGITKEGHWLAGDNVLGALESGKTEHLKQVALLPDSGEHRLFLVDNGRLEPYADVDVVFPILHGTFGEDGTLQGLLEMSDLAYVGAGVLGSSVGMDKALFKDVMRANQIPVVDYRVFSRWQVENDLEQVIEGCESIGSYPLFVKPANLGSSVGITKVRSRNDLMEGLMEACRYDRRILVERGINAREIEVSVLGNADPQASIPGEIIPCDEFYSYDAKYIFDRSDLLIPAPISQTLSDQIREMAVRAYLAIDCSGMARADFLMDKDTGEVFLSEVNTIPGFTRISMYPKLWEASGLSYPQLVERLVELALERKAERDRIERHFGRKE